jgi:hypothetical protein
VARGARPSSCNGVDVSVSRAHEGARHVPRLDLDFLDGLLQSVIGSGHSDGSGSWRELRRHAGAYCRRHQLRYAGNAPYLTFHAARRPAGSPTAVTGGTWLGGITRRWLRGNRMVASHGGDNFAGDESHGIYAVSDTATDYAVNGQNTAASSVGAFFQSGVVGHFARPLRRNIVPNRTLCGLGAAQRQRQHLYRRHVSGLGCAAEGRRVSYPGCWLQCRSSN